MNGIKMDGWRMFDDVYHLGSNCISEVQLLVNAAFNDEENATVFLDIIKQRMDKCRADFDAEWENATHMRESAGVKQA